MIKLLNGHSLTEKDRFQAETMQLTLNQRQSTARITIGPEAPEIIVGEWVQDMTEPGAGIVWRVRSIDEQRETQTRTLVLEHVINTLKDQLMFGEVKPSDMGGGSNCTAEQAFIYVLGRQSDWTLGDFEYSSVSNPYSFNGDDLMSALETVSSSLENCWWSYDFSTYPFTLNIKHKAQAVGTELREYRNINTAKITIDRSRMYTRLYPIGKNNLHIDGNYVSKNESLYGVISHTETDQSKSTKAELLRWANELINNHSEPAVTVTVQAMDYSRETGESLDHIVLGAMCRMPLREYGTVIEETITQINYPDKIREPEVATVTLANIQDDVASIISRLVKSGGGGRRTDAKNAEEDHAWIEDTTEHVTLIAEGLIGKDSQGNPVDWSRITQLGVDGQGIHGTVQAIDGDLVIAQAAITANENAITAEVTRATGQETSLSGQISVEAGKISQIVSAVGEDGEVTAASICLAINESGDSEAVINASKIYLLGQTIADTITANYISSKIASLSVLEVAAVRASGNITTSNGYIMAPNYYLGSAGSARSLASGIWALRIQQSGNTYTLQKQDFDDSDWLDVGSFSRATTLSGAWSGRNFTVTADPQGNIRAGTVYDGIVPDTSDPVEYEKIGDSHYVKRDYYVYSEDEHGDADTVILKKEVSINADAAYQAGYTDGSASGGQTTLSASWAGGKITVTASPQGESIFRLLQAGTATWSGNTVSIPISSVYGSSGQYSEGVVINPSVDVSSKLQSKSVSSNGTFTPDNGYIGLSSVTVAVPATDAKARFNGSSGSYYIEAYDNVSGNPVSGSSVTYKLGLSGNKVQIQNSGGSKLSSTPEYDISTLLTNAGYAGRAAVTLNDPTWNTATGTPTSRTVTVSTSGRTNSSGTASELSKSVALYLTQDSWSSNKKIVRMRQGSTSGTTYAQVEVDASSLVTNALNAGKAAVGITDASWSGSSSAVTSRTVSVSTTGRTNTSGSAANLTTSVGLYLTQGDWGGTNTSVKTVYLREGSASGTVRAQVTVDATSRYANGWNANRNAWIAYGSLSSYQGVLQTDSYVKTITSDINGNAVDNGRGGYWWVPGAWFVYASGAGSNHQGDLAANSYIELVRTMPNGQAGQRTGATWKVPGYSNSATVVRVNAGAGGVAGWLYYKNQQGQYVPCGGSVGSSCYWYRSSTNIASSMVVHW